MAVYRQVHTTFWQDAFILDLEPEEKFFYIYLMTNSKTTQSGIYELPKQIIQLEMGYDRKTVDNLLKRFIDYGKILYNNEHKEIMLINWLKYNPINSESIRKCVEKELSIIKTAEFLDIFSILCTQLDFSVNIPTPTAPPIDPLHTPNTPHGEEKEKEKEKEEEEEKEYVATDVAQSVSAPAGKSSSDEGAQSKKTGKGGYTAEFEQFWQHYPRKIEKKRAYRAWKARVKEGADPLDMIRASENYSRYCDQQKAEPQYTKHGSTFLGPDKPYEDFIHGIPEQAASRDGPQSWDPLRELFDEYSEQEGGVYHD